MSSRFIFESFDAIRACDATFDAESDSTPDLFGDRIHPIIERVDSGVRIDILLDVAVLFIFEWVFFLISVCMRWSALA